MEFEATTKRACLTCDNSAADGEPDRLSALPDCLLHTIMSFMKARQVVQTCVLSTRWRHLWCSVPCLDLDLDEFKVMGRDAIRKWLSSSLRYNSEDDKDWEDFEYFAINLMSRRNIAALDSLRLHVNVDTAPASGSKRAATWLRRAMKYRAPDPGGIRRQGLSSSSWRLKRLELCNVQLDSHFSKHVSSVCLSLEDLKLEYCKSDNFAINSHSLKNLVLHNYRWFKLSDITSSTLKTLFISGGSVTYNSPLVITAPAVAYLKLSVDVQDFVYGISINEMTSLYKASIYLRCDKLPYGVLASKLDDQFELLRSISNVTHLELSNMKTKILSEESKTFEQFMNLRSLLLVDCDLSADFRTLTLFLENSPNLEKLTLRFCKVLSEESKIFEQFKNLRTLLLDCCDLSDDLRTLTLFLENSPNLEKLTLNRCKFSSDSTRKKRPSKSKKTSSSQCRSLEVVCVDLKLTEIIYEDDDDVRQLVELLLRVSGKLPKNLLKLTRVD